MLILSLKGFSVFNDCKNCLQVEQNDCLAFVGRKAKNTEICQGDITRGKAFRPFLGKAGSLNGKGGRGYKSTL